MSSPRSSTAWRILAASLVHVLCAGGLRAADAKLQGRIEAIIGQSRVPADGVAVAVISDRGEMLVAIRADKPMKPASNMKVLTTAAALHCLGAEAAYETTVSAASPPEDGRIGGDLVIRGSGDPNISGRFYGGDAVALLRRWAAELKKAGLRDVTGDIVADDTLFDDVRILPGWDPRQEETWYSAQVSALSLNDNCVDVTVRPAKTAGRPAVVETMPRCGAIQVEGSPETTAGGATRIIVHRRPGTNRLKVEGQIQAGKEPWMGNVTFDDPALVFASAFLEQLRAEGINVRGKARKIERTPAEAPPPSRKESVLVRHTSTVLQDLPVILKHSQNLHAEILLKLVGARRGGSGSVAGGERAVRKFLGAVGIDDAGLVLADGSGLAHANRVTATLLARVLHSIRREAYADAYFDALPIAGKDGTLDKRFAGSSPLRGNLHAKTGYIRGVSCLSGYIRRGGRVWSFSILTGSLKGGAAPAKALEERIGEAVWDAME